MISNFLSINLTFCHISTNKLHNISQELNYKMMTGKINYYSPMLVGGWYIYLYGIIRYNSYTMQYKYI